MIQHHPGDELMLALAAGRLESGPALVVGTHVERCNHCRAQLRGLQAVGGTLIEETEPELLAVDALARTMSRIDAGASTTTAADDMPAIAAAARPALPAGLEWPHSLREAVISPWHWMGPGMRWSRITLPYDPSAALFLLHIGPGRSLPRHTHTGVEFTQVLYGTFDDGRAVFGAGDFDATDGEIHHQPVVRKDGVCICLAYLDAPLRFDSKLAAFMASRIGM